MDLTDIYRAFHPKATENTFFSSTYGAFSRVNHVLDSKLSLNEFKKIEIILRIISDHNTMTLDISSIQFSRLVVSNPLRPNELQHTRPPCTSPTPRVHSSLCPSSRWCHPAILSSVIPFSSCPQSIPASQSIPMSQLFAWGGQSTGVSALASFLRK